MKNYKEFEKICIGDSDYGSLVLVGCSNKNGLEAKILNFGIDETYYAYIVNENEVEIGSHYELRASFEKWVKIYDDNGLVKEFKAKRIFVYRAKEMGCIIKLIND